MVLESRTSDRIRRADLDRNSIPTGKATAAATRGPASAPRPTSSTPTTDEKPDFQNPRSISRFIAIDRSRFSVIQEGGAAVTALPQDLSNKWMESGIVFFFDRVLNLLDNSFDCRSLNFRLGHGNFSCCHRFVETQFGFFDVDRCFLGWCNDLEQEDQQYSAFSNSAKRERLADGVREYEPHDQ